MRGKHLNFLKFTLLELLIVIAIIAILAAILLPSLAKAKELGKQSKCSSNQRQLGMAFQSYAADYSEWYVSNFDPAANITWYSLLANLNYIKQSPSGQRKSILYCPSSNYGSAPDYTNYAPNSGLHTWNSSPNVRISKIKRPSQTIEITAGPPSILGAYVAYHLSLLNSSSSRINVLPREIAPLPTQGATGTATLLFVGGRHNGRANMTFADGHVSSKSTGEHGPSQSCYFFP